MQHTILRKFGKYWWHNFYVNFTPTYMYFFPLTANTKVVMGKRFFVFASQKNSSGPFFYFFHIKFICTRYLQLYWSKQVIKNAMINVLANFIFRTSYFLNKTILRKSKKNGPALITLLGNGVFILVKKRIDKPVSDKNHDHVWKTMHFLI